MSDALRALPINLEAEQALLGAMLANNSAYGRVSGFLTPEHFAEPVHALIYRAIAARLNRGAIADPVTLRNDLAETGALEEIGGVPYLAELLANTVGIVNAGDYGRAIVDAHTRRGLIALAGDMAERAYSPASVEDAPDGAAQIALAEDALFAMAERGQADRPVVAAGAAALDAVRLGQEAAARGTGLDGVTSGLAGVDRMLGGWPIGAMSVVAGRPGMGKSALGLTVAARAAAAGHRVLFASLEMRPEQVGARLVAAQAGVPLSAVRKGAVFEQNLETGAWSFVRNPPAAEAAIAAAARGIEALPLVFDYAPGMSVAQLRARVKREKRRGGLGLVVVDYLQLMRATEAARRSGNRVQAVGEISRDLTVLAGESDLPLVVMAQLNRDVEKREMRRPQMSDLRDSGEIEQDAMTICMLYREHYYLEKNEPERQAKDSDEAFANRRSTWAAQLAASRGKAELIIEKNRQDKTGPVRLRFLDECTWFADETEHDPVSAFAAPLRAPHA
jgi:replicative DNA helicase